MISNLSLRYMQDEHKRASIGQSFPSTLKCAIYRAVDIIETTFSRESYILSFVKIHESNHNFAEKII